MARHLRGDRLVERSEGGQSMNLTSSRRADEFSRLLESGARTDDPVTGPMLAVAESLRAVPVADGPRPEFRAALRQRLVAVATVQGVGTVETPIQRARAAGGTWKVQRRLTALAAGAAVVTGVTGVSLGASRSLPGDPFYGVKRAAEGAQLATTVGTEARGKRHLGFARTRLREVSALAGHSSALAPVDGGHLLAAPSATSGRDRLILDTLADMDAETRAGANDLFAAYRDSGSLEPLRALDRFTQQQYRELHALLDTLPAAAQASARSSLALLAVIATDNVRSATASSPAGSGATPGPTPTGTTPAGPKPSSAPSRSPGGSQPSTGTGTGAGSLTPTKQSPVPVPTSVPTVQTPDIPTIPPLPPSSPLPTSLPTLPGDLTGLLGQ
jgi:hypothetical protein